MNNLDNIKTDAEQYIDPLGAPGSILAENHQQIVKDILTNVGKYVGAPFKAHKQLSIFPAGSMSWESKSLNTITPFQIKTSKLTSDLNDFGLVLGTLQIGDLLRFKDFKGRSVFLLFNSFSAEKDGVDNDIYFIEVQGFSENINYTYQDVEILDCIFEVFQQKASSPTNTSDLINDGSDGTSVYVESDELTPIAFRGLDIQDINGISQFFADDFFRIKGGEFTPTQNLFEVSPLKYNTIFLSALSGSDTLFEENNPNRPFKSLDAVCNYLLMQSHLGENWFVEILDGQNYFYNLQGKSFKGLNIISQNYAKIYFEDSLIISKQWIMFCPNSSVYFRYSDTSDATIGASSFVHTGSGSGSGRYVKHFIKNVEFINNRTISPTVLGRGFMRNVGDIDTFYWENLTVGQGGFFLMDSPQLIGKVVIKNVISNDDNYSFNAYFGFNLGTYDIEIDKFTNNTNTVNTIGGNKVNLKIREIVSPFNLVRLYCQNISLSQDLILENTQLDLNQRGYNILNGNGFNVIVNNSISADLFRVNQGSLGKDIPIGYSKTITNYIKNVRINISSSSLTPRLATVDMRDISRLGNQFIFHNTEVNANNDALILRINNHVGNFGDYQLVFRGFVKIFNNNYLMSSGVSGVVSQNILVNEASFVFHDFAQISSNPNIQSSILNNSTY